MQIIRPDININFVGLRHKAFILSGVIIFLGMLTLFMRGGLRMGVDFAGGTLIQVKFNRATDGHEIRKALHVKQAFIQEIGAKGDNEYLIRTNAIHEKLASLSNQVEAELAKTYGPGQQVLRVEMVGPKVGHDLRQKALYAIFFALLFIAVYISGRFEFKWTTSLIMLVVMGVGIYLLDAIGVSAVYLIGGSLIITLLLCWFLKLPYALGALLSLIHDILITVGIFALFNKEFTLEVFAALLTLSGYSLNDTIIVFDRIRENRNKDRKVKFSDMINGAINQTLSRTVLTSMTVFFVILCLFLFGGSVIHDFSFAMLIGVVTGTYSSVFVASPILIAYEDMRGRKRLPQPAVARRPLPRPGEARPVSRRAASRSGEPKLEAGNTASDAEKPAAERVAPKSGEDQPAAKRSTAKGGGSRSQPARNTKKSKKQSSRQGGARKSARG